MSGEIYPGNDTLCHHPSVCLCVHSSQLLYPTYLTGRDVKTEFFSNLHSLLAPQSFFLLTTITTYNLKYTVGITIERDRKERLSTYLLGGPPTSLSSGELGASCDLGP